VRLYVVVALAGLFLVIAMVHPSASENWITPGTVFKTESITLRNPSCEAVILTKPFVRLISFRLANGRNHLVQFDSPNPLQNGRLLRPLFVTGAKLWPADESPDSYKFGLLPGIATQAGQNVDVHLGPDTVSGWEGRIEFTLDPVQPKLTISSTLHNAGTTKKETGCWWPVSFEPGGKMEAKAISDPAKSMFHFQSGSGEIRPRDPACTIQGNQVSLDLDRPLEQPTFKVSFLGREINVIKSDCTYCLTVIHPIPEAGHSYFQNGSTAILYRDQRTWFCEAEFSSPKVLLQPGEETSFTFSIDLKASPSH